MGTQSYLKLLFVILIIALNIKIAYSQGKQANIWHFGYHAGLNFNTGSPPSLQPGGQTWIDGEGSGVACISDLSGNLLFYGDGTKIWNKYHNQMLNGDNMGMYTTQGAIIVPDPGDYNRFYYFNFSTDGSYTINFQYSVIDMTDGVGQVLANTKCTRLYNNTSSHLSAIISSSDNSIWVVTHEYNSNCFLAFKVTADSIHTSPVKSYAGKSVTSRQGYMKISPNGELICLANYGYYDHFFNVLSFDCLFGVVSESIFVNNSVYCFGVEFSPNNELLYVSEEFNLFQYNLKAGNPEQILNSENSLTTIQGLSGLQLGPDGKIYLRGSDSHYLSVINYPNIIDEGCDFNDNSIFLGNDNICYHGLPTFIQSYLNNPGFKTSNNCFGQPTQFTIANTNGIDSVSWEFKDFANMPNDTSTLFSPTYTFSAPGTYYPELTVWSGVLSKMVKDTVIIKVPPTPQFPNDTSYCAGETIDIPLDAGPGQSYSWNNAWPTTNQTYHVTSPGRYTVTVNDNGCFGRDTIYVVQYTAPLVDTTTVDRKDASCGGSDGGITGIQVTGTDISYEWLNSTGNVVSDSLDLLNVAAGVYTLNVSYGANCPLAPYIFIIENPAAPVIDDMNPKPAHCDKATGELEIRASSTAGLPLLYSLNGTDFYSSSFFTDLPADFYTVTVKDANNCVKTDTVTIKNIQGPTVTDSTATNENGYTSDGTITISAQGTGLIYSLNNGSPQSNGVFTGLSAGSHEVKITDQWGCERFVYITVGRNDGTILSAYAGGDSKCRKELAHSSISANNFVNVKEYKAVLKYNNTRLNCTGYNPADDFPDLLVSKFPDRIEVLWQSNVPKTVTGTVQLVDLIFETIEWGLADIKWDSAYSVFKDDQGNIIHTSLEPGVITINNPPELQNLTSKTTYCEGERAELTASTSSGIGPFTYTWETPVTVTTTDTTILIDSILVNQSGTYRLKILDSNNCSDILSIPVTVYALPSANFTTVNDTIFYEQQTTLIATQGYASYAWNTGDTTYYTYVDKEGEYSVLIETTAGCQKMESVVMSDAYVDIKVPNAFTPNSDGLNDTFKPLVNLERIRQYHIAIYNKWGQLLFESSDPLKGWQAHNLSSGVYTWVIDYKNKLGKAGQMKGSVSLIK